MHNNWKLTIDYWLTNSEAVEGRTSFKSHWSYRWERWQNKVYHWKCIQNKNNPCRFVSKCFTSDFIIYFQRKEPIGVEISAFLESYHWSPYQVSDNYFFVNMGRLVVLFCVDDPWAGLWSSFLSMIPGAGVWSSFVLMFPSRSIVLICVSIPWAGLWSSFLCRWSLGRPMVLFCVDDPWAGQWSSLLLMIPGLANGLLLC